MVHKQIVKVHYLPARSPPSPPRSLQGVDQETGQSWLIIVVYGPPAANGDKVKEAAA